MATDGARSELHAEYLVQVLDVPIQESLDGQAQVFALVVLRRLTGFLIAVPRGAFSEEDLTAGLEADAEGLIGQSTLKTVPAGRKNSLEDTDQPVPEAGSTVDVLLIDVSSNMAAYLFPFAADMHSLDLITTFSPDQELLFPLAEELAAATWEWIADPSSGQRVTFYSADEREEEVVPETPGAETQEAGRPTPARARKATPKSSAMETPRKARPTVATLAATVEQVSETLPLLVEQLKQLQAKTDHMEQTMGGQSRPSALQAPLGQLTTHGSAQSSGQAPSQLLKEMPLPKASFDFRGDSAGWREATSGGTTRPSTCGSCTESGAHHFGEPSSKCRPDLRSLLLEQRPIFERCSGKDEAPTRTSEPERNLLCLGHPSHGQEDATLTPSGADPGRACTEGHSPHHLCGEIRRIWTPSRTGELDVADCPSARASSSRQHPCRKRCGGLDGSLCGAGRLGQRQVRCGADAKPHRRPSIRSVHQPLRGGHHSGPGLCPTGRTALDHNSIGLHPRDGPHSEQEDRCHWKASCLRERPTAKSKESAQKASKGRSKGISKPRGRLDKPGSIHEGPLKLPTSPDQLHDATLSFRGVLAALPRWILATRTNFASFLARSFHIQPSGISPDSIVFPLPLVDFDLFKASGPHMSSRRWVFCCENA